MFAFLDISLGDAGPFFVKKLRTINALSGISTVILFRIDALGREYYLTVLSNSGNWTARWQKSPKTEAQASESSKNICYSTLIAEYI